MRTVLLRISTVIAAVLLMCPPALAQSQAPGQTVPDRRRDRGDGLPTSMFGTYISKGELLVYPFFEYYRDGNFEYSPFEFGVPGDEVEFRGKYRAREGLIFLAYGFTDMVAVEFEAAVISASLEKSASDLSKLLPPRIEESGLGDIEGQVRWRWNRESDRRPEIFSYAEVVVPHNKTKLLIGYARMGGQVRHRYRARIRLGHADGACGDR